MLLELPKHESKLTTPSSHLPLADLRHESSGADEVAQDPAEIARLQQDLDCVRGQLLAETIRSEERKEDLDASRKAVEKVTANLHQVTQELMATKPNHDFVAATSKMITFPRSNVGGIVGNFESSVQSLGVSEKEVQRLQEKLKSNDDELVASHRNIKALNSELEATIRDLTASRKEVEALQKNITLAAKQMTPWQSNGKERNDNLQPLLQNFEAIQRGSARTREELQAIQKERDGLHCDLRKLREALRAVKAEDEKLHAERLVVDAEASRSAQASKQKRVAEVSKRDHDISELKKELCVEQTKVDELTRQLRATPSVHTERRMIQELEAKLQQNKSQVSRLANDNHLLSKRVNGQTAAMQKMSGELHEHLTGAAHLVVPSASAVLPKFVFSCVECFVNNTDCDDAATCYQCSQKTLQCSRWRCSTLHKLGKCSGCSLIHDEHGWLMAHGARPIW